MESREAPITYLYQCVEKYKQENNITPDEWYSSLEVRSQFWEWLKNKKESTPMTISFSVKRSEETREMLGELVDE